MRSMATISAAGSADASRTLAGRWFARTAAGRRWWTLSLIAGVVLVDAFGVALAVARKHFAVS